MFPNIETVNADAVSGAVQPLRRETDRVAETYRAAKLNAENVNVPDKTGAASVLRARNPGRDDSVGGTDAADADRDRISLNFSLNRKERDAFISAFSGGQDPAAMSEEEKETLRDASKRIVSFLDDAIARHSEDRERVEKALSEWYSRISKGDRQGPTALISLLRATAMDSFEEAPSP